MEWLIGYGSWLLFGVLCIGMHLLMHRAHSGHDGAAGRHERPGDGVRRDDVSAGAGDGGEGRDR